MKKSCLSFKKKSVSVTRDEKKISSAFWQVSTVVVIFIRILSIWSYVGYSQYYEPHQVHLSLHCIAQCRWFELAETGTYCWHLTRIFTERTPSQRERRKSAHTSSAQHVHPYLSTFRRKRTFEITLQNTPGHDPKRKKKKSGSERIWYINVRRVY